MLTGLQRVLQCIGVVFLVQTVLARVKAEEDHENIQTVKLALGE
jgi:hypothetical protein